MKFLGKIDIQIGLHPQLEIRFVESETLHLGLSPSADCFTINPPSSLPPPSAFLASTRSQQGDGALEAIKEANKDKAPTTGGIGCKQI